MSFMMRNRHRGYGTIFPIIFFLLAFARPTWSQSTPQDPDYSCSKDKPCAVGCCGNFGICGMGPDFCGPGNCVNSCDAKAECDPAGWGPQYALSEGCPLNVCCSKFGFCGTTTEFCGNEVIANPTCSGTSASQRTIGYYEGWSTTRSCDAMPPEALPLGGYTHINFAFASIDPNSFTVVPASDGDVDLYTRLTSLKNLNPNLQVWISIGGWSMNDPDQTTATTFSDLAGSTQAQAVFSNSLIQFMSTYGFDGVDIDWEYPVAPERSGRPEDFANYPQWLSNLRAAFGAAGHSWGLSITLPSSFWYLQNFDIVRLESVVDWFNIMEYDLHGTWDSTDVWVGPYVNAHTNLTEIDQSLKLLWRNHIDPSKVVLGIGFYGRSFTLQDPSCKQPGCPFTGAAPAGPCTDSPGTLSFAEIQILISSGADVTINEEAAVKIVTWDNNWVSYDDAETLKIKVNYANSNCLGGTMVWAISLDDGVGTASNALAAAGSGSQPFNVLEALNANPIAGCTLTQCLKASDTPCPPGQTSLLKTYGSCGSVSNQPSTPGTDDALLRRYYCCPSEKTPTCEFAVPDPKVDGCSTPACPAGTVKALTASNGGTSSCPFTPQNFCCKGNNQITPRELGCDWTGCGSGPTCPAGTQGIVSTVVGLDGDGDCFSGVQTLCCPTSLGIDPNTCSWNANGGAGVCRTGCPPGQVHMADGLNEGNCLFGITSYCCNSPAQPVSAVAAAVQDFQNVAEQFMEGDPCFRSTSTKKKRAIPNASVIELGDMSLRLEELYRGPALSPNLDVRPFEEGWDRVRNAVPGGNMFPDSAALSSVSLPADPSTRVGIIGGLLCSNLLTSTFDPFICSSTTCTGSICPVTSLDKRDMLLPVPPDVGPVSLNTNGITNSIAFTSPRTFGGPFEDGYTAWFKQAKNLDWWLGSNHGVSRLTGKLISSSIFVSFTDANSNPTKNLFTGAGPVYGCTTLAVVSNRGAFTAHFWQGAFENDNDFVNDVLNFLTTGTPVEGYPNLLTLALPGGAFDRAQISFLDIVIMTPQGLRQINNPFPFIRPVVVPIPGTQQYPDKIVLLQSHLRAIFGANVPIIVKTYSTDQGIWKWVSDRRLSRNGNIHWSWMLDRSIRSNSLPWLGMLTVQRQATAVPGVQPAIRIYVEDIPVVDHQYNNPP